MALNGKCGGPRSGNAAMGGKNWRSAGRSVIGLWDTAQSDLGKPADQIGYDKAPHLNEDKLFMEPENWEADKLE